MARRGKTSFPEDLTDLVAMLPWWTGVLLSGVSYALLHHFAGQPVIPAQGHDTNMGMQAFWRGLAYIGQYVIPAICLVRRSVVGMAAPRKTIAGPQP